jgi:hypothetical protein
MQLSGWAVSVLLATILALGSGSFNTERQLARWSFDGSFDETSPANIGPADPVRNAKLAWDEEFSGERDLGYLSIRRPGFIHLPALNIRNDSFTMAWEMRLPTAAKGKKQILYADWSRSHWQFISQINPDGKLSITLRRDIPTTGSTPGQDLVRATTESSVPFGAWFDVAISWDRTGNNRKVTIYIDQVKAGEAVVREEVKDLNLKDSKTKHYQFGRKNDEASPLGTLDADIRSLRVFADPSP